MEQKGDIKLALEQWEIAKTVDPNSKEAQASIQRLNGAIKQRADEAYKAGMDAWDKGIADAAQRNFLIALRLDPELAPAYTLLAAGALESRQPDRALPNLQRAIAVDPGYGPAYVFLGLTYKALDQPAEAIAAFEQALIRADDEVTRVRIRRYLGELYEAQEQSQTP